MSNTNSTTKAIIYAFAANFAIALTKTGIALWTGSSAMLAEAIHSFADCGNQVLLYIGMKRAAKIETDLHPMGFGRESYIWAMLVAITLFSVGGLFSVHEGWLRYQHPEAIENTEIALVILILAVIMEGISLSGAFNAMKAERGERSLWHWFRDTHSSELMVVVGEDIAAILGLLIAVIMLALTLLTGNPLFDAVGSMIIGVLLIMVALLIGMEIHSLLLGESDIAIREGVKQFLQQQTSIQQALNVWAINHGSNVMVAIKAELLPDLTVSQAVNIINTLEKQIKVLYPRVKWVFFEIDDSD